jgi:hypothetical protein
MALAVSQSNMVVEGKVYDAPAGWHWAMVVEVEAVPGWSMKSGNAHYYTMGGWTEYNWEGQTRVDFRCRLDSGGPAVDMTNSLTASSVEGYVHRSRDRANFFTGIVCVRD